MSKPKQNATEQNPIELYFQWWLDELKATGFIKYYEREPQTILVMEGMKHQREIHLKTKENKFEEISLTQSITYTYDYRIIWDNSAIFIFTEIYEPGGHFRFGTPSFVSHRHEVNGEPEIVSYVDVKPHASAARFGGKLSSFYTFPYIQKILLTMRGLFINKAIPTNQGSYGINTCLFATTFTPRRYQLTDGGRQNRNIKFKVTTVNTFVKKRRAMVEALLQDIEKKNAKNNQQTLL
jgi:hypothetical protein